MVNYINVYVYFEYSILSYVVVAVIFFYLYSY